jgi:hypothetical protein
MAAPSAYDYATLSAAFDAVMALDIEHVSSIQVQAEDDTTCYCCYIDPGFPGNPKCVNCEKREKAEKDKLRAFAEKQLALPEGDPTRIFSNAEIRDLNGTHCDKRGMSRLLLRELRKLMGLM